MRFIVSEEVFEKLGDVCFGVVVARGINNQVYHPASGNFWMKALSPLRISLQGSMLKKPRKYCPMAW